MSVLFFNHSERVSLTRWPLFDRSATILSLERFFSSVAFVGASLRRKALSVSLHHPFGREKRSFTLFFFCCRRGGVRPDRDFASSLQSAREIASGSRGGTSISSNSIFHHFGIAPYARRKPPELPPPWIPEACWRDPSLNDGSNRQPKLPRAAPACQRMTETA